MKSTDPVTQKSAASHDCNCQGRGKLAYAVMFIAIIVLAATGIGTFALGKAPMTHWILMLHVSFAPLFALGLAAVSLTWSGKTNGSCFNRFLFRLVLLCGLVVILSGVVPMTPLFGTHGEHTLYLTHRYSAIVLTALAVLHLLTTRRAKA